MKKIISILMLLACLCARADLVTVNITITNIPANGATVQFNSDSRFWTNTVTSSTAQLQITNCVCSTTNKDNALSLFNSAALFPFSGGSVQVSNFVSGASNIVFTGLAPLTFSASAGWCTTNITTNTTTPISLVGVPFTSASVTARTNWASGLVAGIDANSTNKFSTNDVALANYVPVNGLFLGTFSNGVLVAVQSISGVMGNMTNGTWTGGRLTNGQNFGNPFRSPGTGTGSEQFGLGASATANQSVAFGDGSVASAPASVALGNVAQATGAAAAVAVGDNAVASNPAATAIGTSSAASGTLSTALGNQSAAGGYATLAVGPNSISANYASTAVGYAANSSFDYSTALGQNSANTIANQVALGTASESVWIPGALQVDGGVSNLTSVAGGTNVFKGATRFPRYNNTALANGANQDVNPGTNVYVKVSGPSGAFSIAGIATPSDGRMVILQNSTGQTVTISNDSGSETTPANRIYTGTGADISDANAHSLFTFIYDAALTHWMLVSYH